MSKICDSNKLAKTTVRITGLNEGRVPLGSELWHFLPTKLYYGQVKVLQTIILILIFTIPLENRKRPMFFVFAVTLFIRRTGFSYGKSTRYHCSRYIFESESKTLVCPDCNKESYVAISPTSYDSCKKVLANGYFHRKQKWLWT